MIEENLNLDETMEARRHAIEASLRMVDGPELASLTDVLFPTADHPYMEQYLTLVGDPANGPIYRAQAGDGIQVLYLENKHVGMWFIPGLGMGRLEPAHLELMQEIVQAKRSPAPRPEN